MLRKLGLLGLAVGSLLLVGCGAGCAKKPCQGCGWQSWCTVDEAGKTTCYKATDTKGNVRECRGSCQKYAAEVIKDAAK